MKKGHLDAHLDALACAYFKEPWCVGEELPGKTVRQTAAEPESSNVFLVARNDRINQSPEMAPPLLIQFLLNNKSSKVDLMVPF